MAAKRTTLSGSVMIETVGQALSINRFPVAGDPPTVGYGISANFCDHTYLMDAQGNKIKLLLANENFRGVNFTHEEVMSFVGMPITSDMVGKPLGDIIGDLWDAKIVEELNKPKA